MQRTLAIPQRINSLWNPSTTTASRPRFAEAADGLDYAVKHDEGGRPIRAMEWLCTQFASFVHIPVPPCSLLDDGVGNILFGSQIVQHSVSDNIVF